MEHDAQVTRAWVLHPDIYGADQRREASFALEEAISLADALAELEVVGATAVKLPKAHAGMLFGSGKIEELGNLFNSHEVGPVRTKWGKNGKISGFGLIY